MGLRLRPSNVLPLRCVDGQNHQMQREVRTHPTLRGDWIQDRLVCTGCKGVLYDWDEAFKRDPKIKPNGHDGVEV